ncbi:MAG: AmmeMemoRadiSam system protein B [Deltaproteobacteria bacterium CG2_30_63_29]|nr:MAG: AmmeMemoRadiSam system protein B [Deltaproteobacteria bacterium CG2_30_63_29]PJB34020.1 MAG: AmmeMemoRadiSam system protein B [Deltaproteobacteria bacterium CG_4_9_14_3_um_filter_63_12]
MDRQAAVAGRFYAGTRDSLWADLESYCMRGVKAPPALAVVVPHAGYVYSGETAGKVYSRAQIPRRAAIFGPNHTGVGDPFAVSPAERWLTPLGPVPLSSSLTSLLSALPGATRDARAHLREHCLEVQVPFLQYFQPELEIAAVVVSRHSLEACRRIGEALGDALLELDEEDRPLLVASTDMTHFLDEASARAQDLDAIEHILALEPAGLYDTVMSRDISMCGVMPTTIVLFAAARMGATRAELVEYTSSARASGDSSRVVGYAGLVVH